jgi:hypothetical protein
MSKFSMFCGVAGAIYLGATVVHWAFPGIQSGADQIYRAKGNYIRSHHIFQAEATHRVLVCGTSKILSGFDPRLFDRLAGTNCSSFNLGMPGSDAFIQEQETLVARGETPTHLVLTQAWGTNDVRDLGEVLRSDAELIRQLFPFRKLPRDLVLFSLRARHHGGLLNYYRRVTGLVEQMKRDQGYHFIESQSHYPGHRLPDDFRSEGDDPARVRKRQLLTSGPVFERLLSAARRGNFKIIVAPSYYREGEAAPAPGVPDEETRQRLAANGIEVCGPDYWVLPPRLFSDPAHLNPEGAQEYTRRLWLLINPLLGDSPQHPTAAAITLPPQM